MTLLRGYGLLLPGSALIALVDTRTEARRGVIASADSTRNVCRLLKRRS